MSATLPFIVIVGTARYGVEAADEHQAFEQFLATVYPHGTHGRSMPPTREEVTIRRADDGDVVRKPKRGQRTQNSNLFDRDEYFVPKSNPAHKPHA